MKKTLIGIVLILCLVVGLLPITASADSTAKILLMGSVELSVTEGGEPVYTRNMAFDAANTPDGSSIFQAWTQEICDGTGTWNVKFEWPAGGSPTVTLQDAKFDYFDNDTQTYAYLDKGGDLVSTANRTTYDLAYGGETANNLLISAIMPVENSNIDLTVILKGSNLIETGSGFILGCPYDKSNSEEMGENTYRNTYFQNLSLVGEGQNQTTINCDGIGIYTFAGYDLFFTEANLTFSTTATGTGAIPVHVTDGNLIIDGGNIKVTQSDRAAIWTKNGNLIINDGIVDVTGSVSPSTTNGILQSAGQIIINGGIVNITAKKAMGLYANNGIEINGGTVNIMSPYYGLNAGNDIVFNGGTTNIMAQYAFYDGELIKLDPGVMAYAGTSAKKCEIYDGSNSNLARKPWMRITDDPEEFIELDSPAPTESTAATIATRPSSTKVTRPVTTPTVSLITEPTATEAPTETSAPAETAATEATASQETTVPTEAQATGATLAPTVTEASKAPSTTQSPEKSKATKLTIANDPSDNSDNGNIEDPDGPNAILIILLMLVVLVTAGVAAWFVLANRLASAEPSDTAGATLDEQTEATLDEQTEATPDEQTEATPDEQTETTPDEQIEE